MDYKSAYLSLFNNVSDIILKLQQAQQTGEEICIEGEAEPLSFTPPENTK